MHDTKGEGWGNSLVWAVWFSAILVINRVFKLILAILVINGYGFCTPTLIWVRF